MVEKSRFKESGNQLIRNFNTFSSSIEQMLAVIDLEGRFIEINRWGAKRLGYEINEIRGLKSEEVFSGNISEFIKICQLKSKRVSRTKIIEITTNSGEKFPAEISCSPGSWDNREVIFVVGKDLSTEMEISNVRETSLRLNINSGSMTKDEILQFSLGETLRFTKSKLGFFGEYIEKECRLENIYWIQTDKDNQRTRKLPDNIDLNFSKTIKRSISNNEPVVINKISGNSILPGHEGIERIMLVPMSEKGRVLNVVGIGNKPVEYNEIDSNLISIFWDSTNLELKRKKAEDELRESEREYRNLFDSSLDALLLFDIERNSIILCNETSVKLFGYDSQNELLEKSPMELSAEIQPGGLKSADEIGKNISEAMENHVTVPHWNHVKKDGTIFPSEVTLSPVVYKGRRNLLASVRDTSDQYRLKSELRRSEEIFELAVNETGLGVWDYDAKSRVMSISSGIPIINTKEQNTKEYDADTWLSLIHPDDLPIVQELFINHLEGKTDEYRSEYRVQSDEGDYHWLLILGKAIERDDQGMALRIVGVIIDIGERKKLEKELSDNMIKLDTAISGTGNGLWDWDLQNNHLTVNDNWIEMLGYTRADFEKKYDSFNYDTFADHVHPDDVIKVGMELEKHFAFKTNYYRIEIRMKTIEGDWKWILAAGKVWEWDNDKKPLRMVGIHIDIDYRIRIEERLKKAIVKAEESDRLKSAFLANMSHEIRTPMNGIIGFLDLIENTEVTKEQSNEYMNIIRNSSTQLLNIVNDIVDISKIEAGQIDLNESPVNIRSLFEDLSIEYKGILRNKDIEFNVEARLKPEENIITTDQTKLRQVLTNLLSNSVKFTQKGKIQVTCKKQKARIIFCVEDTGKGIDPGLHDSIFERFRQVETGLSRLSKGTGLGLAISKAYIEKMGGEIWLESESGKGSKFFFSLPFSQDKDCIGKESQLIDEDKFKGLIMVVEDEIYNFMFVEKLLTNVGFKVLHAGDGYSALELLKEYKNISIVLMDIRLPGMNGYEITRKIKEDRPTLPVIALTAFALSGDREKALEAGCDDYLKKPVEKEVLIRAISKFIK